MTITRYHYIMGKCMGKLEKERMADGGPCYTPDEVLEQYARSIKYAPEKTGSELLPEPHHKLVSSACKYVLSGEIQVSVTPFLHGFFSHNCSACCCV